MRDEEFISRKVEHLTIAKERVLVNVPTKNDFFVRNTENAYWQTVYIYASICHANNFSFTTC